MRPDDFFVLLASIIQTLDKPSPLAVQLTDLADLMLITPKPRALKCIIV